MAYTHGYVDGSSARSLEPVRRTRPLSARTRRNSERALAIRARDVAFFSVMVLCVVFACVFYLSAQSKVTQYSDDVQKQEKELQSIVDANNATEERLNSSLDSDAIYRRATKELGMVYASDDQVIYYDSTSPDYVVQYGEIPGKK